MWAPRQEMSRRGGFREGSRPIGLEGWEDGAVAYGNGASLWVTECSRIEQGKSYTDIMFDFEVSQAQYPLGLRYLVFVITETGHPAPLWQAQLRLLEVGLGAQSTM